MTALTLPISETFGPTFQGEGPNAGRLAHFIRFGLCNLTCSWCDTPYTWDHERYDLDVQISERDVGELLNEVRAPLVVLTGGEPMLQSRKQGFRELLVGLAVGGVAMEVETNGTIPPPKGLPVVQYNVSPKLANAGMDTPMRPVGMKTFADLALRDQAVFKFVVTARADLEEVTHWVVEYKIPPGKVWIMPEGTSSDKILAGARDLAEPVLKLGFNLTTRLQTLLWEDERGR